MVSAESTNISVQLNEEIIGGIKVVGNNSDQMQKSEEAVYRANYGTTVRPQGLTLKTKSQKTKDINNADGCPRGGTITKAQLLCHSLFPHQCVTFIFQNSYLSSILLSPRRIVTGGTLSARTKNGQGCHVLQWVGTSWTTEFLSPSCVVCHH